jgi:hypothetical protein
MSTTPIAIFAYNRPVHTQKLLESLIKCSSLNTCPIYLFCDGAKVDDQKEKVQNVRTIVNDFAKNHNAKVFEASENLGLSLSIIRGISQVSEIHDRIIVLEDDLVLHPKTLDFMIQALDRYEDDPQIGHVSGFSFPLQHSPQEDAILLPLFNSWGWATWSSVWKEYEWSPEKAIKEIRKDAALRRRLYPYSDMLEYHFLKNEMVWDLLWHWKLQSMKKIGVFPSNSLIWCSGFDETATHTGRVPKGYQTPLEKVMAYEIPERFRFPKDDQVDPQAVRELKKFLHSMYATPLRMFYRRVRDRVKVKFNMELK